MKTKFCGITNIDDYKFITQKKVDYTGFIFYKKSPRYISPQKAEEIFIENQTNKRVGVFVNETIENIIKISKIAKLDIIQLHGDESPEFCNSLPIEYWKVFRIKSLQTIEKFKLYNCKTILIDTYSTTDFGGTGKTINIDLTLLAINEAQKLGKNLILAGGICSKNILEIKNLPIFGVDINSGVEDQAGVKNHKKVSDILELINA